MKQKVREKVIAELLGVSERTVRNWRMSRIIPYTKVGRIILFDPEAVEQALRKFERKAYG
jgi:excisionase family DNA binding protein